MRANVVNLTKAKASFRTIIETVFAAAWEELGINDDRFLNVILTDDANIREYNRKFRDKDAPTDVLSFPSNLKDELGDVFISLERAKAQANEYGHSFERELAFLSIHGLLHCLGYDHQDKNQEDKMFSLQDKILNKTPYER